MPVDDRHPAYEEWEPFWAKCRHSFEGPKAIKASPNRTKYLPLLEEQETLEYIDYVERAQWFPGVERTVKGHSGAVLRKDTRVEAPTIVEDHLDDITMTGVDFHGYAGKVLPEMILMGRVGGLVEMPMDESSSARPYWSMWTCENVTNWATMRMGGALTVLFVVLREVSWQPEGNFGWAEREQYRVLELVPIQTGVWRYRQVIWRKLKTEGGREEWVPVEEIWPMRRGVLMETIPFVFFGATTVEPKVEKPPSLDLVEINIGHYRNSADYENALTAIRPMWALAGYPVGTSVALGPRRAIITERAANEARAEILQGVDPVGLRLAMAEKRHDMAVAGGRLLEGQPETQETAQAVRMRHSGDEATLRVISANLGRGLERMLRYHAVWVGADPQKCLVEPNQDFISSKLTPQQLVALNGLLQAGAISYPTFYHNLAEGETARPGVDWEAELEQIRMEEEESLRRRETEVGFGAGDEGDGDGSGSGE